MLHLFNEEVGPMTVVYICSKLAVFYPEVDVEKYFSIDYLQAASKILNTDGEKIIFADADEAKQELHRRGTAWCIYEISIPSTNIKNGHDGLKVNDYLIKSANIQDISFHPASGYALRHDNFSPP